MLEPIGAIYFLNYKSKKYHSIFKKFLATEYKSVFRISKFLSLLDPDLLVKEVRKNLCLLFCDFFMTFLFLKNDVCICTFKKYLQNNQNIERQGPHPHEIPLYGIIFFTVFNDTGMREATHNAVCCSGLAHS